ncbi:hypothetical protein [Ferruginivarius sediminum]|uniref:hypothetical protein n=1 Tax=Ferruginivarius sediminum TaxID=2661937 RepID=UPI0012933363|nr:hypothetical protein [Ferruginivarius sediminum]
MRSKGVHDDHILGGVIEATQALTGVEIRRACVDKGYRGHNAPKPVRVMISYLPRPA